MNLTVLMLVISIGRRVCLYIVLRAIFYFPPFFVSFILNKKIGVGQPKVVENAKILIANTAMDTDKIKIYGSRVRVDSMNKASSWDRPQRG